MPNLTDRGGDRSCTEHDYTSGLISVRAVREYRRGTHYFYV